MGRGYQAVVLAGGEEKCLFPLTSGGVVKALLPVANKPLLSYPLRTLEAAGLRSVIVVVIGDKVASAVSNWITHEYFNPERLHAEVVSVPEEFGTADALRAVASRITSNSFVVLAGDLVTDLPLNALVASHELHSSLVTMVLSQRKVSPASETKPGKPPKNVDYIGLDESGEHLLFYASSPDAIRDLRVPMSTLRQYGNVSISSDLQDAHLYICDRAVLETLTSMPKLSSLRQDMLPLLARQQAAAASKPDTCKAASADSLMRLDSVMLTDQNDASSQVLPLPGSHYMSMSHHQPASSQGQAGRLRVHVVASPSYCARVCDVQAYGEVNREVADPAIALHISGAQPSRYDNIVSSTATLGNKTTVAAGCIVGDRSVLGDKTSIKRSVLGADVKLGVNVKVINSVLMDNVSVGDGAHIQNSVLCAGAVVQAGATLKDCQVGPAYSVAGGVEYKSEVLATKAK